MRFREALTLAMGPLNAHDGHPRGRSILSLSHLRWLARDAFRWSEVEIFLFALVAA
jgi:hypothetical protein